MRNTGPSYGQYCPLAMSGEILANRWTMLVIRELLDGSTGFNEISRGVPLMSRSLLTKRLRELDAAGIIHREDNGPGNKAAYTLTPAGKALGPVIRTIAEWGQEWIDAEPALHDIDVDFLMWDIRRNVKPQSDIPNPFVVHFAFSDAPAGHRHHWLVFKGDDVDLCYIDPGHEPNVHLTTDLTTMVQVWMGWHPLPAAIKDGSLTLDGPQRHTRTIKTWLGLSGLAHIPKRPDADVLTRPQR